MHTNYIYVDLFVVMLTMNIGMYNCKIEEY